MKTLFYNNSDLQKNLDEKGYVVFDLLGHDQVDRLQRIYEEHFTSGVSGFTSTNLTHSKPWRKALAQRIFEVIETPLRDKMQHGKFWLPAFLIKPHGVDTEFKPHQDWTFVDETQYVSGNVWIPLCDTDSENGTLYFIEKSHHLFIPTFRVQAMPLFFEGNEAFLKAYCTPVPLKKGQAVFFYHSVIHYSPANVSDKERVAVSVGVNSEDADLKFYHRAPDGHIEEYLMPDNYVFEFEDIDSLSRRPEIGKLNRVLEYTQKIYSQAELEQLFSDPPDGGQLSK